MSSDEGKSVSTPNKEWQGYAISRIIAAQVLAVVAFAIGYNYIPPLSAELETKADRVIYALQWQVLSVFTIFLGVWKVGGTRYATAAIDPIHGKAEHLLEVPQRYLQNTLEQYALHFIGQLLLGTFLSPSSMQAIPVLVVIFVVGRLVFFVGYLHSAKQRALGFALTFAPTIAVYFYCVYRFTVSQF